MVGLRGVRKTVLPDSNAHHARAVAALDESFFRVRFDRSSRRRGGYLRAMAELGPGPHRSGQWLISSTERDVARADSQSVCRQTHDLAPEPR